MNFSPSSLLQAQKVGRVYLQHYGEENRRQLLPLLTLAQGRKPPFLEEAMHHPQRGGNSYCFYYFIHLKCMVYIFFHYYKLSAAFFSNGRKKHFKIFILVRENNQFSVNLRNSINYYKRISIIKR